MDQKLIVIDGKTYKSVEEMPEDVRRNYEQALGNMDKDRNGIPDMLENANAFFDDKDGTPDTFEGMTSKVITTTKVIVNGREYNSLNDLPPDVRAKFKQAMGTFDSDQNGMPDFLEGMTNAPKQTINVGTGFGTETPRRAQPTPVPASIEPDTSNGWMLALAGLFILLLCVAGAIGVWYFFLR
jgi:hypothetical protein